jgi:L-iditol 2-dehydrogenase
MIALRKIGKGDGLIELQEIPEPLITPDEVMIEVKAAGICGSDLKIWHDHHPYWPPVTIGHEFSGKIVEVGRDVKNWSVSDRVVAMPHTRSCGHCALCLSGNIHICAEKRSIGWGIDGAMTKYLRMPAKLLLSIPAGLSYEEAAVTEPLAVAVNAVLLRSRVEPGDFVVVFGPGPIGFLSALVARAGGASTVVLVGVQQDEPVRLARAQAAGVNLTINIEKDPNIEGQIMDMTHGVGADLVIEASGARSAIGTGIQIVRRLGRIAALGVSGTDNVPIPWDTAMFKACDLMFNFSTTYQSWDRALRLMDMGAVDVKHVITEVKPLADWLSVFSNLEKGKGIKSMLVPG